MARHSLAACRGTMHTQPPPPVGKKLFSGSKRCVRVRVAETLPNLSWIDMSQPMANTAERISELSTSRPLPVRPFSTAAARIAEAVARAQ
jgi:hypothetical protein